VEPQDAGDNLEPRIALFGGLLVSIIVPARNEAENLRVVLPQLPEGLHEVILVDGNSTDNTIEAALETRPDIRVLRQTGAGKGDALRLGFEAATGDVIVMMDADGSTDPSEIVAFVEKLRLGADVAMGSRYLAGGGSADITRLRTLGNRTLTRMVNVLFRTQFTDLCYGYLAFWRRSLGSLNVDGPGFEIETLLHISAATSGLRMAEVPSYEQCRIFGESNLSATRDGLRILRVIAREFVRARRPRSRETYRTSDVPATAEA
jgi:glycosyltransferase involved in cell wall biosynthesis